VFWPTFVLLAHTWASDPQYSHGYFVGLFSAFLLWKRREYLSTLEWNPSWWGVVLLAVAAALRMVGVTLGIDFLDAVSLLPCLAGLFVLLGGWRALAWSWPAIVFLLFMIPLPYRVAHGLAGPLQTIATQCSAYVLQTIGLPALAEGNTILLNQSRIAVVEACSGLSMLFLFIGISTATALVVNRRLLDRIVILFSAIPIAMVANVARITATGVAQEYLGPRVADAIFHGLAGWLMMPLALILLWGVVRLLDLLLKLPAETTPLPVDLFRKPRAMTPVDEGEKIKENPHRSRPPVVPILPPPGRRWAD
jgi:exosortase